jgi:hypothetical protein
MNRTIIASITIIAVAAVAIFGLRAFTQATAANTVSVHDADVNWDGRVNSGDQGAVASKFNQVVPPGGRPVAEQNLDGNGNIRVAQQGPVDVNVVSQTSALPVTRTLFLDEAFAGAETKTSASVDVSGCTNFELFVTTTFEDLDVQWSLDEDIWFRGAHFGTVTQFNSVLPFEGFTPFLRLVLRNGVSPHVVSAWVHCR